LCQVTSQKFDKGPSIKYDRPDGGGSTKSGRPRTMRGGRTSISEDFDQIFCVSDSEDIPSPDRKICCVLDVFGFVRYGPDVRGFVPNRRCWTGEGGGQKSGIPQTSLMDDPNIHVIFKTCNIRNSLEHALFGTS